MSKASKRRAQRTAASARSVKPAARRLSPEQVADTRQRDAMRKTLHEWVDLVCDAWPDIEHQARQMGGGFPASDLGERTSGGGGSEWSGAAGLALTNVDRFLEGVRPFDPAERAAEWVTARVLVFNQLGDLAGDARRLRPLSSDAVEKLRGRQNDVENCTRCEQPAPSGRDENGWPLLKRNANGEPFHAGCYQADRREKLSAADG